MIKKITSFSALKVSEGRKVSYTVTTVDDNGNTIQSNERKSFLVIDATLESKLQDIENYITNREAAQ